MHVDRCYTGHVRKLTPAKIALARKLRADGLSRAEVAEKLGVSAGSVSAAWRVAPSAAPPPTAPPPRMPAEPAEPAEPLTKAALRELLSTQIRDLRDEIARADASDEPAAATSTRRILATLVPVVARLVPDDPADSPDIVRVDIAELRADQDSLRAKLHDLVDRVLAR